MIKKITDYLKQDLKLRNKLLLIEVLIVVIPSVLTVTLFYNLIFQNTVETVLESRRTAANTAGAQIEDSISQMKELSDIISNTDLLKQVLTLDSGLLQASADGLEDTSVDLLDTYKAVLASRLEDIGVSAIRIYCEEETDLLNELGTSFTEEAFFAPVSQIQYSYWKSILQISGENSRLFPGYYLSDREREECGGMSYVQKVVYSKEGDWREAYVAVYRNDGIFGDLTMEGGSLEGELAYVIDSRNVLVTPYVEADDIAIYVEDYESLEEEFPSANTFYRKAYGTESAYVCRYEISSNDWSLIWVIPKSGIAQESWGLLTHALGTYGVLLLLGIVAAVAVSWSLLGRIYRLRNQMQSVKRRPELLEGETGKDEIGELMDAYNYMVRQINAAVDREIHTQSELNDMRIEMLRAQMDPHFLYNTLDLLRGLSQKGEKEKVEELVLALTSFYRLSLNKGQRFSTVERELLQAECYMKIMNMRFGEQILFVADVAEEILDFLIPVFIFQPILENAIIHGILETDCQSGCITLTGWREQDSLIFLISDDGAGMDEAAQKAVMKEKKNEKKGSNIGVYNTVHRLHLIYGDKENGLFYHSVPGKGTDVKIVVPITEEDKL